MKLTMLMIPVSGFDAARRFYRDALGLPETFSASETAFYRLGEISVGVHLEPGQVRTPPGGIRLVFEVDDVDQARQELQERGVTFIEEPFDQPLGKLARFVDPSGNVLQLMDKSKAR